MANSNAVGWFEIYVTDMVRAKHFYQTVFETTLEQLSAGDDQSPEMWAFPWVDEAYGAGGAICKMAGVSPGGNSVMVYFRCEDCAVEQGRVNDAGGKVVRPKIAIGEYGFISLVTDPDGNTIGLHSKQ
ncbi:VOC family protein [Ferrimonas gelatinilytica]|uniref:VOC family protein n=1 Tax=Ferrimonas gelatinilytica TaxID=1255257 RepID=A0ABP9S5M3_9GAMM